MMIDTAKFRKFNECIGEIWRTCEHKFKQLHNDNWLTPFQATNIMQCEILIMESMMIKK